MTPPRASPSEIGAPDFAAIPLSIPRDTDNRGADLATSSRARVPFPLPRWPAAFIAEPNG
ncbi:hypothetical protein GCM10023317_65970 [Actinopolymorpha pittospori]